MKNQYFGDINDYRKYGLLRSITEASHLRLLVAWMLTPDDGSTDGKFTEYLDNLKQWVKYDPELFHKLHDILNNQRQRKVSLIENTELLHAAQYYSEYVPDPSLERNTWFGSLAEHAEKSELVFLDPDNGIEIKSKPYGRKNSSKFVYWREIEALWGSGKSLLIYQHFIREKRFNFIQRMLKELQAVTPGSLVEAFSTPHVVFLMALQPSHRHHHTNIVNTVQKRWEGQIHHWALIRAQQGAPDDRSTASRFRVG